MKLIGIDYGKSKIGIALSEGIVSSPLKVIRYVKTKEAISQIAKIVNEEKPEKVIVGISEGQSEQEARIFGESLKSELSIDIEYYDETLSTNEAIEKSIEAGISRSRRKNMEDAFAASVMLQSYIEDNV